MQQDYAGIIVDESNGKKTGDEYLEILSEDIDRILLHENRESFRDMHGRVGASGPEAQAGSDPVDGSLDQGAGEDAQDEIEPGRGWPVETDPVPGEEKTQNAHQEIAHACITNILSQQLEKRADGTKKEGVKAAAYNHFFQIRQMPEKG